MLLFTQAPNGALSSSRLPFPNPAPNPNSPLFSRSRSKFPSPNPRRRPLTSLAAAADGEAGPATRPAPPSPFSAKEPQTDTVFVGDDGVPLEGVIQFEKPDAGPSKLISWAQVGFLAGGDVLCLLIFSAIGRFSHGFPVVDFETFRTADPFIAGWFLGAYFLGAYGDDGKGLNGTTKAVIATAKSWVVGIPLGILIRAATSGHIPPTAFMLVTMGSTGILLIGWRALASNFVPSKQSKKNDVYKRGSAFELFEVVIGAHPSTNILFCMYFSVASLMAPLRVAFSLQELQFRKLFLFKMRTNVMDPVGYARAEPGGEIFEDFYKILGCVL